MRLLLAILLISVLCFIAGLYLPWWSIAPIAFLVALLLGLGVGRSFLAGFAGVFLLWALLSLWIDIKNESVLSHKIAQLFPLGGSSILLIVITALVGGLVGGFAAMAGGSIRPRRYQRI
jgi:hypothetical protein